MRALVLSQSRLREPSLLERFDYYAALMRARVRLEHRQVKGTLDRHVPAGWRSVALHERGEELDSEAFARRVGAWIRSGVRGVAFLVGEADGLSREELASADEQLALSRLTLPHQLCFVVLAEQLYRATTILDGGKYHRP